MFRKFLSAGQFWLLLMFGLVVAFASGPITTVVPEWGWQIFIGAGLLYAGGGMFASLIADDPDGGLEIHSPFERFRFAMCVVQVLAGSLVLHNINRYGEIVGDTGPWLLWILGGLIALSGLLMVILDFARTGGTMHPQPRRTSSI